MLVRITAYTNAIEAHLARMRLEVEGIPAFVLHEHHIWAYWLISTALGGVKVYVHLNDIDRAKEIIDAHNRGEFALEDEEETTCPRCKSNDVVRHRLSWKLAMLATNLIQIPLFFTGQLSNVSNAVTSGI